MKTLITLSALFVLAGPAFAQDRDADARAAMAIASVAELDRRVTSLERRLESLERVIPRSPASPTAQPVAARPAGDGWRWDGARQTYWRPLPAAEAVSFTPGVPAYYGAAFGGGMCANGRCGGPTGVFGLGQPVRTWLRGR